MKILLSLTLLTVMSCTSEPEFKANDCFDQKDWVTEAHQLNGNIYRKVVGKTIEGSYLVETCIGKGNLKEGRGDLEDIKCDKTESFTEEKMKLYAIIECPQ